MSFAEIDSHSMHAKQASVSLENCCAGFGYRVNCQPFRSCIAVTAVCATILLALLVDVVLLGANDLIFAVAHKHGVDWRRREFVHRNGFILPGTNVDGIEIDAPFCIFAAIVALICLFLYPMCVYWAVKSIVGANDIWKSRVGDLAAFATFCGSPLILLLLHLLGNIHYQFYCAVGVIASENCFWIFDYRSLVAGFGIPLFFIAIALVCFLVFRAAKWLFALCFEPVEPHAGDANTCA